MSDFAKIGVVDDVLGDGAAAAREQLEGALSRLSTHGAKLGGFVLVTFNENGDKTIAYRHPNPDQLKGALFDLAVRLSVPNIEALTAMGPLLGPARN